MAFHAAHHLLPSIFGILGNIISFCVFLAPMPTFYSICKKKSTQGFQSVPYSVALFSCMLLLFYGYLKTENGMMIITINSIGCAIETAYLVVFLIYATRKSLISTVKLLVLFNILSFGLILVTTRYATNPGPKRVAVVGWICAVFSVCVFAAPLSIMRLVIKTKSVEYMPFSLSLCLTICAVMWFFYGLLIKDYYVATPNVLGFVFGIAQMILYMIYKDKKKQVIPMGQPKGEAAAATVVDLGAILEMQEKAVVEIGVELEIQEKPVVAGDEAGGGKKEEVAVKVACLDLDGEKTVIPSIG
ncbi:putative SWEET sugar transporter [Helianthus annuus]|uniref:Bidirectional sugar transporter SWEET n=1 Tax=Helianthus annuus TaxID=4232 RepID=A0A251THR1_HELAN|nr:bidirectional sugar transporter SWEET9 [Helianthus annuus]KAF5785152.1 putative SWEET sugar transporter [Helianthus annuus]KAJ0520377.1 putative SWEET sugar transporter [Helianthus annuus]